MFKKLRTVIYYVPDMQKAKEWYIDLTGNQPYFDEVFILDSISMDANWVYIP